MAGTDNDFIEGDNMFATHVYFNGKCREAIKLYVKAFKATIKTIIQEPDQGEDALVIHAEICIHNQILMLNDFGNNNGFSKSGGYQLCVSFENEDDLKDAYSVMKDGSITIDAMQATDYSTCVVRFIDRFDVRWGLWCN